MSDIPNPQAYPCLDSNCGELSMRDPGMTLRDWFAGQCDVSAYSPLAAFEHAHGKKPTIAEFAEYLASIRFIEADAMLRARQGDHA